MNDYKGDLSRAISGLEAKYRLEVIQLNRRLRDVTFVLEDALNLMEGLLEVCGQTL